MRDGRTRMAAVAMLAAITCCQGREPVQVCPVPFEIGSFSVGVGLCFPKPLDWNPATKTAVCNLVAEYIDDTCPPIFDEVEPAVHTFTDALGELHHRFLCPVPRLPANLSCTDNDFSDGDPYADAFGWYYCENMLGLEAENFDAICYDGLDNDGNGLTDCDDPACQLCETCGGDGVGCVNTCRYEVMVTAKASASIRGQPMAIRCYEWHESDDPNCRADAAAFFSTGNQGSGNKAREAGR